MHPDSLTASRAADAPTDTCHPPPATSAGLPAGLQQDGDIRAALARLQGGFALHVALADGSPLVAVDRFAIRSMCWRLVDGRLHVHERADVLAAIAPAAPLDEQALFEYLYFHAIPSPRTVYRGVHRLPPAHFARLVAGEVRVAAYWIPQFQEPSGADFASSAETFRGLLQQAVQRQVQGGRAACYLSGGTDSSTVAGMIREATGEPADAYSIGFEAEGYDEMHYARIAAQRFGCRHHEYYVTPADLVASMPRVAAHYDQPFGNSSAVPAYHCALMARADGVQRILAGDGGDELFGGNARYAKQRVFGWYQQVPGIVRSLAIEPWALSGAAARLPLLRKAHSYVDQARLPMPDRLEQYNLLLRVGPERVMSPAFRAAVALDGPVRDQRQVWSAAVCGDPLNRTLAFDWRYTLAENDLPKVTGSAALAGLDVGFPLLDTDLLAFSMQLPASYKLKGLQLRWFFKEALRGFLPDEIITKKKHGFGLPFGVWTVRHPALRTLAGDALDTLGTRGLLQPGFARQLMQELLPQHPGYYGEMVWILTMLELWLREHRADYRL